MSTNPGCGEAVLIAIQSIIQSNLSTLDSLLANINPPIVLPASNSSQIIIGDFNSIPQDANAFPWWVAITAGGQDNGQNVEISLEYIDVAGTRGFKLKISTNIDLYIHPDAFMSSDPFAQGTTRQLFRARFSDWVRTACFNNFAGLDFALTSQEYNTSPNFDHLTKAYISDIREGATLRGMNRSQWIYTIHFLHEGYIL